MENSEIKTGKPVSRIIEGGLGEVGGIEM